MNDDLTFYTCTGSSLVRKNSPGSAIIDNRLYDKTCDLCKVADSAHTDATKDDYLLQIDPNNDPISLLEVSLIRHSMKKGVGSIGLNNDHLRKLCSTGVDFGFQFIANLSWVMAYPYYDWRVSYVRPFYKGKDLDRSLKESYRPISHC